MTLLPQLNKENQVAKKELAPEYPIILSELKKRSSQEIVKVAFSPFPSVRRLVNKYSFTWTSKTISHLISDFVGKLNTNKQMDAEQIVNCAELLMGEYYLYRLDDYYKCLENMVKGDYGIDTYKMDAQVIFKCFDLYDKQRTEAINKAQEEKRDSYKHIDLSNFDEKLTGDIKKILVATSTPKEEIKEGIEIIEQPLSEVQEWMREFDKLYKENGQDVGGQRYILVEGKKMNNDAYITYRWEQKQIQ